MKSQISSVDLHYLIEEMQFLIDSRVDKIYHPKKEELLLQFHVTSKGKKLLRIISGKFIFLSEHKEKYDAPSGFCMFMRKHLDGARVREITQIGSERITKLVFERKETKLNLYIELFGKGNIIATDEKNIIINALQQQKWADREIKKGNEYLYPRKDYDFFKITEKEFKQLLKSDKELVYKLAKDIGLGGVYAEEICSLSGVDKNKKKVSDGEVSKVFKTFKKMIKEKINARVVYKNEKIKDILPFGISGNLEEKAFDSFNAAFDYFFTEEYSDKEEFKSKHQSMIDKTEKIVKQQRKQVEGLEKKAEENNKKGELIYENYKLVEEVLKEINNAREKYSFDEIKKKLKGHKIVKSVDGKDKKIVIEI